MSSVQKKDFCGVRKAVLLRQNSLENVKCKSYALLGSIFSRDSSFIHLLVNTMNSSKELVQKPAVVLILPAVQLMCVAMASCGFVIRKLAGGVSFEKLDKFIAQINLLKSKYQSYCAQKVIKQRIAVEIEKQISTESEKTQSEPRGEDDCREILFNRIEKPVVKSVTLRVASFVCIFLVYTQFLGLIYLISLLHLRAGFIFLLVCTFYISSIVLKISFMSNGSETKRVCRRQQKTHREIKATNSTRPTRSRVEENCLPRKKLL